MFTVLLGIDVLVSGWITAHLLAVVLVYYIARTERMGLIIQLLGKMAPNPFFERNSRWVTYLFIFALLGASFTFLMNQEPIQQGILASVFPLFGDESWWSQYSFMVDDVLVALALLVLLTFVPLINALFDKSCQTIEAWRYTHFRAIKIQNLELVDPDQLASILLKMAGYIRLGIIIFFSGVSLTLVLSLYPQTAGLALSIQENVVEALTTIWGIILAFLPNLFTLLVILFTARFALKVLRFFYEGFKREKIKISSVHAELLEPTYQLLRLMVIAFTLVAAFPYIPGSTSPVFRGLSIFVGFLLSLGSTSLVTNVVSGVVLTYTRGMKIGDRVQIGESVGDVIDRTLLVTRIRTIKNVIVTIPNSSILQNQITNYSTDAEERGLILNTSITIGYDVPWRQVQQLLVEAALATPNILDQPTPFVLKTNLDNYYVAYELNAYTDQPAQMAVTYSDLHQSILDKFNAAGVEIMSPAYYAFRDGHSTTIPRYEYSNLATNQ